MSKLFISVDSVVGFTFAVVDVEDSIWFRELSKADIPYKDKGVGRKEGLKYVVRVICVSSKYKSKVQKIADNIVSTFVLMGFADYEELATSLLNSLTM